MLKCQPASKAAESFQPAVNSCLILGVRGDAFQSFNRYTNNYLKLSYLKRKNTQCILFTNSWKGKKNNERVINHRLNVLFNAVSEIKFPEGKYGHPLFYRHFVSNLCENAKTTFHFVNITIEDTREQKYVIVH